MNKLLEIQQRLHAPKDQRNTFGNYDYRTREGILAALKPILRDLDCTAISTDGVELVGDMVFVSCTAMIYDGETRLAESTAYAMHEASKKGMDGAQITGAASSYAGKRALSGLLAIDNEEDADATAGKPTADEQVDKAAPALALPTVSKVQGKQIKEAREAAGISAPDMLAMMKEAPFSCENPPRDLLAKHVPALILRIEAKMEGK